MGDKTFKVHLDGYNFMPYFNGEGAEGPRHEIFYFTDNGDLMAVRYDDWKLSFKTINGNLFTGTVDSTNVPLVTNLRQDPWERYQTEGMLYGRWWGEKLWTMVPAVTIVGVPRDVQGVPAQPGRRNLQRREGASDGRARRQRRRQVSPLTGHLGDGPVTSTITDPDQVRSAR